MTGNVYTREVVPSPPPVRQHEVTLHLSDNELAILKAATGVGVLNDNFDALKTSMNWKSNITKDDVTTFNLSLYHVVTGGK